MTCRSCGTEIADKALICYRCGTATTEAKFKPPPAPSGSGRRVRLAIIAAIVVALLVLLAFFLLHSRSLTTDASPDRLRPDRHGAVATGSVGSTRRVAFYAAEAAGAHAQGRSGPGLQVTW